MDYAEHYRKLISKGRGRVLVGYAEHHHILPKCLGGGNEAENLVRLTAEEHYVAHQLLVKLHPGHLGLLGAVVWMTGGNQYVPRQNKLYGWLRRALSAAKSVAMKGRVPSKAMLEAARVVNRGSHRSEETKAKISAHHTGREHKHKSHPNSPETRAKISASKKGKVWSETTRATILAAMNTPEARARSAAAHRGHRASPETRAKIAASLKGKKRGPYKRQPKK